MFCNKLKDLMKKNNLSLGKLAKLSGLPKASIQHYANGTSMPSGESLYKLAKVFNVTMEWLLDIKKEGAD